MTVRDLRECLYEVKDQDQEINEYTIVELMMLWTKKQIIESKLDFLIGTFIEGYHEIGKIRELRNDMTEIRELIRNYKGEI